MSTIKGMIHSSAGAESSMDALLEEELRGIELNDDVEDDYVDDFVDDPSILFKNFEYNDDLNDVEIPPEVNDYLNKIELQTRQLEKELLLCDEILNNSEDNDEEKITSNALVPIDHAIEEAAANAGLTVDEFKQKLLKEVAEDDFTEDKLVQEYDEFIQLQKELADLRSGIEETIFRSDNSDLLLAIEAPKDQTENKEFEANSVPDVLNSTDLLATYQNKHGLLSDQQKVGQLVSVAALSCMRDFIQDQLKKNEEVFQARQKNLLESIQNHRHEEERQLLTEEKRKKTFQQQLNEEQTAMMERKKERQEKLEEELKALDDDFKEELNYHQVQINELTKDLELEKNHYEALRTHWLLSLEETRRKAATEIQRIYRGYRTRQLNFSTLKKFEELKVVRKKERFNIRVLEVEYEMKYQQEQERNKKEQEEAEEKQKRLEEEQQKKLEMKRKEEEKRLEEEKRKELERIKELEKLEEERKKREEEKSKAEEKLRQEEEKQKKMEVKKRKEEEKKRLKEDERLRKEEEKRKKEEEKQKKEEEKQIRKEMERKRKEEEKHKQEEERRLKEEEERKKEEKRLLLEEEDKKKMEEMKLNNDKPIAGGEWSLPTNQADSPDPLALNVNNNHTVLEEEKQESPKNSIMVSFSPRPPPCPPPAVSTSLWSPSPGPVVSPSSSSVTVAPMPPSLPQPDPIERLRLSWIKSCIPWSNVANEPWKLVQSTQNVQKRPASAKKKFPPVLESVILTAAHAETLRQVSSVALCDLPGCSLSTFGQCWSLKYLTITHCNLVCLDSLVTCKHLLYINAEYNSIEYVDLKDLGSLQVVKMANNKVSAIHGLDGCINLRWLDASRNNITKLGGLASLRRLHTLNASYNQIISTEGLEKVVTLQELDLSHNFLQQLSGIEKLCLLTRLDLSSNNLLQVPELKNQVLLQVLNLQENSIKSLGSLKKLWLPLLHSLNCSENMLENIEELSHLIMLKHLDVSGNQITESENLIQALKSTQHLETLNLEGNPVVDVDKSGTSLLTVKLNFLQTFNGENLQRVTSKKEELLENVNNPEFYKMCNDQIDLHTTLTNELNNQIKSLLTASKASSVSICQVYFSYCETSFRIANEHRNAHEYGCIDTASSIGKLKNFISPAIGIQNLDNKESDKLSVSKNAARDEKNHSEPAENKKNLSETVVHKPGKGGCLIKTESVSIKKQNKAGIKNDHLMSVNDDSIFSDHSDSNDEYNALTAAVSYTQQPPPSLNSYINEKDRFNLALAGSQSTNGGQKQPLKNVNNNHFEKEGLNNHFPVVNHSLENNITPEYVSQKDMFEMAVHKQKMAINVIKASTSSERSKFESHSSTENMLVIPQPVTGANGDVTEGHYEPIEKNNWSNEEDLDQLVELEDAAFDIDKYLEMDFELDEFLDFGWRPADEPQIPQSSYPVLRQISSSNSISKPLEPTPPSKPMQAWKGTNILMENKGSNSQLNTHGVIPPVAHPSPVPSSVASAAETIEGSRGRSKMDEILQDWGFKDAHTAELMLARAKKMKYNAERKRKLSKLDPKQRLLLFRKLEESGKILSVRPPNIKTLPRKEYFQAREEEIVQQNLQRQAEEHNRINRTYEWIHTQVGDYPISSSRINAGRNNNDFAMDNTFKAEKLWDTRKTSPLSDHKSTSLHRGSEVHARRFSLGDENSGHSPLLPPINKQERISFRDSPVDKSAGWGGGKKRGQKS